MDIRIRYLGLAGAGLCALLLGGCATNFHEAGLGQIDGVQPNQGLVVLRSETNATRVYQNTFLKWDDVYMEADSDAPVSPKDDDRQFYGIPDLLDQMASSETFVGALPAGSYRIVTFSSSV